jgi:hypothetical protein
MNGRKLVLGLIGASLAAAGVALGADKGLRRSTRSSAKALGDEIRGRPA